LLVNNAGVGGPIGPAWQADPETWWSCLEVNLRGTFLCCQAVLTGMLARGHGRIINVASAAGEVAVPYMSAYNASKLWRDPLTSPAASSGFSAMIQAS
jgi:NAD(P)-dependent dehydrogenase (short-subunit alcohol dehydrogenase family)